MMNELIENHIGYAHAIAADLAGKYPPNITRADLEAAAELGLVQAARSFDPSRSVSFTTFAYYRVRGAIFDEVRKSWQANHMNSGGGSTSEAAYAFSPSAEFDESFEELEGSTFSAGNHPVMSLDSTSPETVPDPKESPANQILRKEESEAVRKAIWRLPNRHRFVLQAYYYEELSLVKIGQKLNLSKSWVSRIHAQALAMVRSLLQEPCRTPTIRPKRKSSPRRRSSIRLQATLCAE